jgi:cytidylate kinase
MKSWLDRNLVSESEYVEHLGKIVLLAASSGKVVFVGRGAQMFLPRNKGLAVRIIAPLNYRIEQTMRQRGLNHALAKKWVEETDHARCDFVRSHFHHDVADPKLYDLVINLEPIGPHGARDLIVETAQCWMREAQLV